MIDSPGEKGNYDNVKYIVLALFIERLSGLAYADYIQHYLLAPVGMPPPRFMSLAQQFNTRHHSRLANNAWTAPQTVIASNAYEYNVPFLSADEKRLYFISGQARDGKGEKKDFEYMVFRAAERRLVPSTHKR